MHALAEYGLMHVKLYEDIARHGHIATTYAYPVKVDGRYVMDPSPIPKFDNPKMHMIAGAAAVRRRPREAHLRHPAVHRGRVSLDFEDHPFERNTFDRALRAVRRQPTSISTRSSSTTGAGACSSAPTPTIARRARAARPSRATCTATAAAERRGMHAR